MTLSETYRKTCNCFHSWGSTVSGCQRQGPRRKLLSYRSAFLFYIISHQFCLATFLISPSTDSHLPRPGYPRQTFPFHLLSTVVETAAERPQRAQGWCRHYGRRQEVVSGLPAGHGRMCRSTAFGEFEGMFWLIFIFIPICLGRELQLTHWQTRPGQPGLQVPGSRDGQGLAAESQRLGGRAVEPAADGLCLSLIHI